MTVRPDNRLNDAPMLPVACASCGAQVVVRKSSWEQTSVQWNRAALGQCFEHGQQRQDLAQPSTDGTVMRPGMYRACTRLRASIEAAVRDGSLPVFEEDQ